MNLLKVQKKGKANTKTLMFYADVSIGNMEIPNN